MYLIVDTATDPAWNLAAEEYLLTQRTEPFFRLWRNADSVIIGRHQNAYAEIDRDFVERNRIPVIRRMTGGGAVFHDLGNVNYSFFDLKDRVVAITKCDMLDDELRKEVRRHLPRKVPSVMISSLTGEGIPELKDLLWNMLNAEN